jgi:hypothetical protein
MVRHPDVAPGLLLVMVVLTATAIAPAAPDDIGLVVVFADIQLREHTSMQV